MTTATPDSVISGVPYAVTQVDGHQPTSLSDFACITEFIIDRRDAQVRVTGIGTLEGDSVRFHEKDQAHDGKDVRVWRIHALLNGAFEAQHAAAS